VATEDDGIALHNSHVIATGDTVADLGDMLARFESVATGDMLPEDIVVGIVCRVALPGRSESDTLFEQGPNGRYWWFYWF